MCAAKMVAGIVKRWFGGTGRGGAGGGSEAGVNCSDTSDLDEDDYEVLFGDTSGEYSIREVEEEDSRTLMTRLSESDDVTDSSLPRIRACRSATDVGVNVHRDKFCDWTAKPGPMTRSAAMASSGRGEPVCCCKRCMHHRETELYVEFLAPLTPEQHRVAKEKSLATMKTKGGEGSSGSIARRTRLQLGDRPQELNSLAAVAHRSEIPRRATVGGEFRGLASQAVKVVRCGGGNESVMKCGIREDSVRQSRVRQQQSSQSKHPRHHQPASARSRTATDPSTVVATTSSSRSARMASTDYCAAQQDASQKISSRLTSTFPLGDVAPTQPSLPSFLSGAPPSSSGLPPSIAVSRDGEEGYMAAERSLSFSVHFRDMDDIETSTLQPPPNKTICHVDSLVR